ncbi:30S ribosomal protein S18 [Candidatus Dojkabacteria bacterium]|uniref:Small ribosomal subunit protein bS18 n=1 Tax=Candidatus Dojkabacteria bacterium TaxID=2099670 RepID=A0A3M0YZP5_9BACT|nr:MAG: 30S ribosomal protein S18 [Candidatus Dojkabacteria bacterium]
MKKSSKKKVFQVNVPKDCPFNGNPSLIDYKDVATLKKYISTRGRIFPRSKTGVSAICQRKLALSIKRARYIGLLPFTQYV